MTTVLRRAALGLLLLSGIGSAHAQSCLSLASTDVAVTVFGMEPNMKEWLIGGPLRQLEASGKPLRYIGMDKETVDRVNKKWSTTFTHAVIPANTLPKQPAPLPVGLVRGYKAVHPDFPDEVAYNIVMAVAWAMSSASGFSHNTCRPASNADMAIG